MKSTSASDARQFFAAARHRIRAFTVRGTFIEACALVVGYDRAFDDGWLVDGFQQWLGKRHDGRSELAFWVHVMREAFPSEVSLSPQELTDEQNRLAIETLFTDLGDYLSSLERRE